MPTFFNSSADALKRRIHKLPYGVMFSSIIRNKNGEIVDFEPDLFNERAKHDLPGLQNWQPGTTLWELFHEDGANGLFAIYKHVLESNTTYKSNYYSPATKLWYRSLIQPFDGGVLAMGKIYEVPRKNLVGLGDFSFKLAQYKASVYERYVL